MSPEICDLVVENPEIWARFANRFAIHKTSKPGAFTFNPELNFVLTSDADQYMRTYSYSLQENKDFEIEGADFTAPDKKMWRVYAGTVMTELNGSTRWWMQKSVTGRDPELYLTGLLTGNNCFFVQPLGVLIPEGWMLRVGPTGTATDKNIDVCIFYSEEDLF